MIWYYFLDNDQFVSYNYLLTAPYFKQIKQQPYLLRNRNLKQKRQTAINDNQRVN